MKEEQHANAFDDDLGKAALPDKDACPYDPDTSVEIDDRPCHEGVTVETAYPEWRREASPTQRMADIPAEGSVKKHPGVRGSGAKVVFL